jgi:uncharacterized membrane protein YGL010W
MNYLEHYRQTHQHPVNRFLHTFGIPMVVISVFVVFWNWRWGLGLFVLGWIFQFAGHVFEGKAPAFFSNPIYLLVGPYWWLRKILGRHRDDDK